MGFFLKTPSTYTSMAHCDPRERESKQQASKKLEGFLFGYAPLGGPLNHGSN